MRVFVTGASGYIGTAVTAELIGNGHEVLGLARSDASAARLEAGGAQVHRGSLNDLDTLRSGAAAADAVIHLAYIHDFAAMASAADVDMAAVQAIGSALEGSGKPFVGTSGTLILPPGRLGTEDYAASDDVRRGDVENVTMGFADRGIRSSFVRLAPTVHADSDKHGFVPALIGFAREHGSSAYVGDGANRWPAVHVADAAVLFRLAVESAPAGTRLHGAAEQGIPFREIAEAIGRGVGVPAVSVTPQDAGDHLGFLGAFAAIDNPTSSERTQELLGWTPTHVGLLDDLAEGHYFQQ